MSASVGQIKQQLQADGMRNLEQFWRLVENPNESPGYYSADPAASSEETYNCQISGKLSIHAFFRRQQVHSASPEFIPGPDTCCRMRDVKQIWERVCRTELTGTLPSQFRPELINLCITYMAPPVPVVNLYQQDLVESLQGERALPPPQENSGMVRQRIDRGGATIELLPVVPSERRILVVSINPGEEAALSLRADQGDESDEWDATVTGDLGKSTVEFDSGEEQFPFRQGIRLAERGALNPPRLTVYTHSSVGIETLLKDCQSKKISPQNLKGFLHPAIWNQIASKESQVLDKEIIKKLRQRFSPEQSKFIEETLKACRKTIQQMGQAAFSKSSVEGLRQLQLHPGRWSVVTFVFVPAGIKDAVIAQNYGQLIAQNYGQWMLQPTVGSAASETCAARSVWDEFREANAKREAQVSQTNSQSKSVGYYASRIANHIRVYFPRTEMKENPPGFMNFIETTCFPIINPKTMCDRAYEERTRKMTAALESQLPKVLIDLCTAFLKLPTPLFYLYQGNGSLETPSHGLECQNFDLGSCGGRVLALPTFTIERGIRVVRQGKGKRIYLDWNSVGKQPPFPNSTWRLQNRVRWRNGEETLDFTGRMFERNGKWAYNHKRADRPDERINNPSPVHSFTFALFPDLTEVALQSMWKEKSSLPNGVFLLQWSVVTYLVLPENATEQEMMQAYEDALLLPPPKERPVARSNFWDPLVSRVKSAFGIGQS